MTQTKYWVFGVFVTDRTGQRSRPWIIRQAGATPEEAQATYRRYFAEVRPNDTVELGPAGLSKRQEP